MVDIRRMNLSAGNKAAYPLEIPQSRQQAEGPSLDALRDSASSLLQSRLGLSQEKAKAISDRVCSRKRDGYEPAEVAGKVIAKLTKSGFRESLKSVLHFGGLHLTGTKDSRLDIRAEVLWQFAKDGIDAAVRYRDGKEPGFQSRYNEAVRGY